jgi:hypothetical protein
MVMPLPPEDTIRQMRFSSEFWLRFFTLLEEMDDMHLLDLNELDQPSADLFFTNLADRMIREVGEDNMPVLDDTIRMIRIILHEELQDRLIEEKINRITNRMDNK